MKKIIFLMAFILVFQLSCSTKKAVKFSKGRIPTNSNIAVIIDSPNNIKNVVMAKFLTYGFRVKAINATDFYALSDIFDIDDLKKLSYNGDLESSMLSMEKSFTNIYKLHVYNFEVNKAEVLADMKNKWNVQYLVLLDLKDWEEVSWGRVINLNTYDIIWLENYPNAYDDNIETVTEHFIKSMTGKK